MKVVVDEFVGHYLWCCNNKMMLHTQLVDFVVVAATVVEVLLEVVLEELEEVVETEIDADLAVVHFGMCRDCA